MEFSLPIKGVTPAQLAAYAEELLRPALPEGFALEAAAPNQYGTYKNGFDIPPIAPDSVKVWLHFGRRGSSRVSGSLTALQTAAGCLVRGAIEDSAWHDLDPVWVRWLADVRELAGEREDEVKRDKPMTLDAIQREAVIGLLVAYENPDMIGKISSTWYSGHTYSSVKRLEKKAERLGILEDLAREAEARRKGRR